MKKHLAALTILTLVLVGCNSNKKSPDTPETPQTPETTATTAQGNLMNSDLDNTSWELTTLAGQNMDQTQMEGKKIQFTLNSADNTINGFSGCNTFNGTYKLEEGGRITFSSLSSTKMACKDVKIDESEILKIFNLTDNYTLKDGVLSLNAGRRAPFAVFKKTNTSSNENSIVGKRWLLKKIGGKEVALSKDQNKEIYFRLNEDNTITGFAGCNTLNGAYTLEKGNRIKFENMAATLKMCTDLALEEAEVLGVFNLANNYTINGYTLHLNVGKRAPLAVFEANSK